MLTRPCARGTFLNGSDCADGRRFNPEEEPGVPLGMEDAGDADRCITGRGSDAAAAGAGGEKLELGTGIVYSVSMVVSARDISTALVRLMGLGL
jgi:hypothetical protein